MAGLLPQMSLEPAPGYRRFVECHFEALRRDARRLADHGRDVDAICSLVLADIALRWRWFELLRVWLRRSDPAGAYLGVALARRTTPWHPGPAETRVDVFMDPPRQIDVEVVPDNAARWPTVGWYPDRYVVDAYPPVDGPPAGAASARPVATSAAVRIAAVRPLPTPTPSAEVEAVIAWLHAHETYERYRRVTAATAATIATAVLFTL